MTAREGPARDDEPPGHVQVDLGALYRSQGDHLRRVAYLLTGETEAAEELVHDTFVRVHGRLDDVEVPEAYLRTTLVNACLAWKGREAMARERRPRPDHPWVDPPEIDETWDLLDRLPRDQRAVLVLRYYEDLSDDQISDLLGCRSATVRTRIHRALKKLRREMTR